MNKKLILFFIRSINILVRFDILYFWKFSAPRCSYVMLTFFEVFLPVNATNRIFLVIFLRIIELYTPMEHPITSQKMTLSASRSFFGKWIYKNYVFGFLLFAFSYFFTNFSLVIPIEKCNWCLIRVTYRWHDYKRVTYGWHTRKYKLYRNDIRAHASDIRMKYDWHTSKYKLHVDDIRMTM